ncbi:glutathione S-transferase N-terminal domain-containing protein [Ruegeria sp. Ofav3-42]|uniref:glutathione S-transferase N-terminal domain-containing protein n=1 Tax=Ruegeria sp. Ofav3-42 TaxID=2917759 RepID=UPI001EF42CBE|nr:glutathione S-transferase N-terminal domain-containing protein [Ruegeria sp. Ofav3-42]MCG7522366.1 glutathione S-transferase N-terminal domain-containing protein [Ruegeria sp. Ofav3-42]
MKLYIFETCPFCVRARIMAGLKDLSPELVYVAPGQIPPELDGWIDRLTVPILLDGETLIQGSTEIIRHFDTVGAPKLPSYSTSQELEDWRSSISAPLNALCYPRMSRLNVPELVSPEAQAFFECAIPERIGMTFADALAQTPRLVNEVKEALPVTAHFLKGKDFTFDTLAALADLRSLTMVAELSFPEQISGSFRALMTRAGVAPFIPVKA